MLNAPLRLTSSYVLTVLISALMCIPNTSAQAPVKYALLIAVSQYDHATLNEPKPLQFPEADAKAVGSMLQEFGYKVDLLLGPQATQVAIRQKLDALSDKGNRQGVVVVGFWGRGHCFPSWVTEQSMFCPFDAAMRTTKDYDGSIVRNSVTGEPLQELDPAKLVGIDEVMAALDRTSAGNRVLLADSCVDITGRQAFGYGLTLADLPANTAAIVTHTNSYKPFEYEPWGLGGFTKCLLDLLPQIVAKQDDVTAIVDRLKPLVAQVVSFAAKGSERQSVELIMNGAPKLLLVRPSNTPDQDNATAKPEGDVPAKTLTSRTTGMEFAMVPRGTFTMGSTDIESERERDETLHDVTITRDFYLGKHEVTQAEFQRVMGFNPSFFTGSPRLPAERVSWFDAVWFCNRLSELDGRTVCYEISGVTKAGDSIESATVSIVPAGNGYRLPTEAEWEYACRAGTTLPFNFGGNITPEQANFKGNSPYRYPAPRGIFRQKTVAVDELGSPNKFGLVNMHGNVWEWCWDWKAEYVTSNSNDPPGPNEGRYRVLRGGGFVSGASYCRSAYRNSNEPKYRAYSVGFRVALGQ